MNLLQDLVVNIAKADNLLKSMIAVSEEDTGRHTAQKNTQDVAEHNFVSCSSVNKQYRRSPVVDTNKSAPTVSENVMSQSFPDTKIIGATSKQLHTKIHVFIDCLDTSPASLVQTSILFQNYVSTPNRVCHDL